MRQTDGPSPGRRSARRPPAPRRHWAFFFDLDGTLVDLAESPSDVRPDRDLRQLVGRLSRSAGGAVALITGRSIADIDRLFRGRRLPVAGQHGTERRDAGGHMSRHRVSARRLAAIKRRLADVVARHPGLILEDKGLSIALHYRRAPRLAGYAHRLARWLQQRAGRAYRVQPGHRVVEVKPAGRDKGIAIREFMQEAPFRGRTPVFIGDDLTDEYGFTTVNRLGGCSVKVGPGPTAARWRLPDVRAVRRWLNGRHRPDAAAPRRARKAGR